MGKLGALGEIIFTRAHRMGQNQKNRWQDILIHTLRYGTHDFKFSIIVCIGSHAFAMLAHKKNYGRAGYVDDPLPNIVYVVFARMHAILIIILLLTV